MSQASISCLPYSFPFLDLYLLCWDVNLISSFMLICWFLDYRIMPKITTLCYMFLTSEKGRSVSNGSAPSFLYHLIPRNHIFLSHPPNTHTAVLPGWAPSYPQSTGSVTCSFSDKPNAFLWEPWVLNYNLLWSCMTYMQSSPRLSVYVTNNLLSCLLSDCSPLPVTA